MNKIFLLLLTYATLTSSLQAQTQLGQDIDGEAAYDWSGWSVSMSSDGSTLAIGAHKNDGNGTDAGHVRVYNWSGSAWVQKGTDIDGEALNDLSGNSVSISSDGNTVAIGAPYNDGNGTLSGHVRVYTWNGFEWLQKGIDLDGEAADDCAWSGTKVSLSSDGNTIAIGAPYNDGNGIDAGHVRVYTWNGTAWAQKGIDLDGEAAGDISSGYSVSLSSDGNTVAIGAIRNDGNGSNSGHVRVYTWNGTAWVQKGIDIEGEAQEDYSGRSVSLSSDGNTVAIGATGNDDNGSYSGHVRVYSLSNVGINEIPQNKLFSVYPNPAKSQINVKADVTLIGSAYTVFDNTGKSVLSGKINSENTLIELGTLAGGIYLFSIGDNLRQTFKVLKE